MAFAVMCCAVVIVLLLLWARHNYLGQRITFRRVGIDAAPRKGRIRYVDDTAGIFVFPSFTTEPYLSLNRVHIDLLEREGDTVLLDHGGKKLKIWFDRAEAMAFTSWLESAPSRRLQNVDKAAFRRYISRRAH